MKIYFYFNIIILLSNKRFCGLGLCFTIIINFHDLNIYNNKKYKYNNYINYRKFLYLNQNDVF